MMQSVSGYSHLNCCVLAEAGRFLPKVLEGFKNSPTFKRHNKSKSSY
jgi:hypothetical protein